MGDPPLESVRNVSCPVLAVYGERDRFVTPGAVALRDAMKAGGKTFESTRGARRWPLVHERPPGSSPQAVAHGWDALLTFFARHLRGATG